MMAVKKQQKNKSLRGKAWMYIVIFTFNILIFASVGMVYVGYTQSYSQKLYNENLKNVENVNSSTANAAETYIRSMGVKADDVAGYVEKNDLTYEQTLDYLSECNSDPNRQFQLILCATYEDGESKYGDFSGVSIKQVPQEDGSLAAVRREVSYENGYTDLNRSLSDLNDEAFEGVCTTPEFTDADSKLKCFAIYRHVTLKSPEGEPCSYAVLLSINSGYAMSSYTTHPEYDGQATVLVSGSGDYILKNVDFKGINFYDYLQTYNDLTLDERTKLRQNVQDALNTDEEHPTVNLFYKNHENVECVFCVTGMSNDWNSITCVPQSSFNLEDSEVDYSLIILLLFAALFLVDGIAIYFVAKVMKHNVTVARKATAAANSANLAKSRFLSTMSHELRTPLNAIIGLVSLSKDNIDSPAILSDYLEKMYSSSKLLLQLISDILDVSAIESDKIKLNYAEFDMTKLISSLSAIYYSQCTAKGIEFDVILKSIHSESLMGDSVRLNQILLNFLSNAVKFTPQGGKITLRVEQTLVSENTVSIRFDVIDTGCGISDELKGRLFKPFEQAKGSEARAKGGSGLGLSIAKNLVELMNGHVELESEEGRGSCFSAVIPFEIPDEAIHSRYSLIEGMRVLAAVGDSDSREYLGQILSHFGLEHTITDSAQSTIEQLRHARDKGRPFTLCMLDWKLSDLDAVSATREIRAQLGEEPMIMVMAYDLAAAKPLCLEAGANSVFEKPVFPSPIYNALEELSTGKVEISPDTKEQYDLGGKRVLLVEDNKLNIEIANLMLKKFGLEVETAEDGQQGLDTFIASDEGHFDAILMDIQMPVMDGYEATRAIRRSSHPQALSIPILAMTADAFSEDVKKAHASGMNVHLSKPIEPDVLYRTLKEYI